MDRVKSELKIQLEDLRTVTCFIEVKCHRCKQPFVKKNGFNRKGIQRYLCCNEPCPTNSFMLQYCYQACIPEIKEKIVDMAVNGCGVWDTARLLKICKASVIKALKSKEACLVQVNPNIKTMEFNEGSEVSFKPICDEAEIDEQWSFVSNKSNQRWIWYAIDHVTGTILAYVFGKRKDEVFKKLKALLEPFGIQRFYTDDWGAYERNLDQEKHSVGKRNTQKIERKNLNLRTWIKRLARKTICFSMLEKMHEIVIGLLINKIEFGIDIHAQTHI